MRLLGLGILSVIIILQFNCSINVAGGTSSSENTKIIATVTLNGLPAAGVELFLRSREYLADTAGFIHERIPDAVTDAEGEFTIDSVGIGEYIIECNDDVMFASMVFCTVDINSGEVVNLGTVQLQKGVIVSGTALHDKIVSADIFVRLYGLEYIQRVDSAGNYHFSNVPAGNLTVNFITDEIDAKSKDTTIILVAGDSIIIDTVDVPDDYESDSLAVIAFLANQGIADWVWDSIVIVAENRIRQLKLWQKNVSILHPSIKTLTFLNKLDLKGNNLSELPDEIQELKRLWHLLLGYNPLQTFPKVLENMPWLITINLDNTGITKLPDTLAGFPYLEALSLEGNALDSIPSIIPRIKTIRYLGFDKNNITVVPEELFDLNLRTLTLGDNTITHISPKIGQCTEMFHFTIYNNAIDSLPEELGNCISLKSIWAGNNGIKKLPDTFGNLVVLEMLQLANNQLETLPDTFGNLTALVNLHLNNNELTSLPSSITQIDSIETVLVANNHLVSVPPDIESWLNEHAEPDWKVTQSK